MPARLEHQRATDVVVPRPHPFPLLEHRLARRRRESVDDQPERLAGGMRIDRFQLLHDVARVSILRRAVL